MVMRFKILYIFLFNIGGKDDFKVLMEVILYFDTVNLDNIQSDWSTATAQH